MQYKYAEIADTVYFWFAANDTTGTAADGATPLYRVRLAGAAAGAAATASGTPTLLTHADFLSGIHEIAIDTTGYAAGEYSVFCSLTVSSVSPVGFVGSFKLRTAGTGALGVTTVTNSDKTGYRLDATGSAAMTESYAADGAAPTLPQCLFELRALLAEKSISGTTLTTKKLDGTTTAATYTLDSATTPTSITRAT